MKRALITGITGQDGSYLAEFLASVHRDPGDVLLDMPSVGEDADFERPRDVGRKTRL